MVKAIVRDTSVSRRCKKGIELAAKGMVTKHGDLFVVHGVARNYTVCLDHQTYGARLACRGLVWCPEWIVVGGNKYKAMWTVRCRG